MTTQQIKGNDNLQVNGDLIINHNEKPSALVNRLLKISYFVLVISLVSTTLPNNTLNIIASICTMVAFLSVCLFTWESRNTSNSSILKYRYIAGTILIASLISGCAGPMLAKVPDPAIADLVREYKSGVAQGIAVFGFGLENIDVKQAAQNGGIEEVYFADKVRGYGLISIAKVSVFGD